MATAAVHVRSIYRSLLRTLEQWPSVKKKAVMEEIRTEFRQNAAEVDAAKIKSMVQEAEAGLVSLRQQCGLSVEGTEINYAYDEALSRGR